MKIEITEDDIKNGEPENGCYCPIALAVKRAFPHIPTVEVDRAFISLIDRRGCEIANFRAPLSAIEFMKDFDEDNPVGPFVFELDYPE